ncbi:hypothetical protein [Streptomyces sp. NBC_00878]|uniref:hypothetical protein n=1 Tax=Streptomyces sp. NBC_00878 TaxID=2975854 RepID=UPI0022559237|nr:hypothetical protein [Streptomyces sp. NBC_00878]MCX4911084.1 hypothetical protein [Streptomyces sp. NBC_00878]
MSLIPPSTAGPRQRGTRPVGGSAVRVRSAALTGSTPAVVSAAGLGEPGSLDGGADMRGAGAAKAAGRRRSADGRARPFGGEESTLA